MPALSRFLDGFLTAEEVELGRIVLDTANPQENFCKAASLILTDADRSRREFTNIDHLTNAESNSTFQGRLTKLLDIAFARSSKSTDVIKTSRAASYHLYNVNDKFETQLQDDKVKKWLEKYRNRSKIYFVVALHTVLEASVTLDASSSSELKAKAEAPVADALDGGVGVASRVIGNPQVQASHTHVREQSASFIAPGERIIAVGYQRVRFKRADSGPEMARKTVWKSFDTSRAAGGDMIEATVEEVSELGVGIQVEAESVGENGRFVILSGQIG